MADITIYTDGSANNATHSRGGYGIVMINGSVRQFCGGQYTNTTSARMEVLAIIKALQKCEPGDNVVVYSDNEYAVNTLKKGWLFRWQQNHFRGRRNEDLWRLFYKEYERLHRKVKLEWIRGHNGDHYNELADALAEKGSKRKTIVEDKDPNIYVRN